MPDKLLNLRKEAIKMDAVRYSTPIAENEPVQPEIIIKKKGVRLISFILIFIVIAMAVFSSQVLISNPSGTSWMDKIPGLSQLRNLAESANKKIKGEENDRINILLLGLGGKDHEGGYLTDTVMVASLVPSTKKAALFSIPRDLTVPIEGMGWRKINSVYAYAEKNNPDSGGLATSQTVNDTLNIPIDYYFRVDFDGFTQLIDEVGGVNVYVENTLDDYTYPALGKESVYPYEDRFEHLHVEKGWQTMDGSLALKFARSRHAYGVEGSDFARAKRQQKIIEATKDKLLSTNMLLKPSVITGVIDALSSHISTNLKIWEIIKLWEMFKDVKKEDIANRVLDDGPDGLLVSGRGEDGAYILSPRSGDFGEIQYLFNNIFNDAPAQEKEKIVMEKSTIEIHNGTWINGLASRVALDLGKYGFTMTRVANANQQDYQKSVIYDLTYGEKIESLKILRDKTGANVSSELPQWLIDSLKEDKNKGKTYPKPDFILILGQDADQSHSGIENKNE